MEGMGARIARLRRERGMTQRELAALLGVTDKAVSKWERGLSYPDVALLPGLSQALGVPLDRLLSGEPEPSASKGGAMRNTKLYFCPPQGTRDALLVLYPPWAVPADHLICKDLKRPVPLLAQVFLAEKLFWISSRNRPCPSDQWKQP